MNPQLKLILMIMLGVFALIMCGLGTWLAKKAADDQNENVGCSSFMCFFAVVMILGAAVKLAGIVDLLK